MASKSDSCVFMRHRDLQKEEPGFPETATRSISCLIVVHVDDIAFAGLKTDWLDLRRCID